MRLQAAHCSFIWRSAGLSSLTAINNDFYPEELLPWADIHFTQLTLSSSYGPTMKATAELVPKLRHVVVLAVPGLPLDLPMAQGLMHAHALRDLCVAWINIKENHLQREGIRVGLPQVQHLALMHECHTYMRVTADRWEVGTIFPMQKCMQEQPCTNFSHVRKAGGSAPCATKVQHVMGRGWG
uniref:Uncharacterized protein n=1 Tax=Dunaliella tertiolecta TaxID=3047 RepID=A0A7S3R5V8_DUNTE